MLTIFSPCQCVEIIKKNEDFSEYVTDTKAYADIKCKKKIVIITIIIIRLRERAREFATWQFDLCESQRAKNLQGPLQASISIHRKTAYHRNQLIWLYHQDVYLSVWLNLFLYAKLGHEKECFLLFPFFFFFPFLLHLVFGGGSTMINNVNRPMINKNALNTCRDWVTFHAIIIAKCDG